MAIRSRHVNNKKDQDGIPTNRSGTVYDVNIKTKTSEGWKTHSKRGFLTRQDATNKGIGIQLGISGNLDSVTAQYVDLRLERKKEVLSAYHNAVLPETIRTIAEKIEKKSVDRGER